MSEKYKIETIVSPTKPGPGWVKVTPEIVRKFEKYRDEMNKIHAKLKEFKAEMLAEEKNANL